jgi:hypothetical protein
MRIKKLQGARPSSGIGEGPAATGFSLQGRSALRIQLGHRLPHRRRGCARRKRPSRTRDPSASMTAICLPVNLGAASRLVLVLIAAHVEIERNARGVVAMRVRVTAQGTLWVTPLVRSPRIACARAKLKMILPSDCAQLLRAKRYANGEP